MRPVVVCRSDVRGGGEGYLTTLYGALAGRGHYPVLVGRVPGWQVTGLPERPVELGRKWSSHDLLGGAVRLPRERRRVARAVQDLRADCFHLQYKREQVGFTRALARRAPVVWTEHGRFPGGWRGAVLAAGYRAAARDVSAIVCVSDQVAEDVRRAVGPGPRVEVVENAVDTATARPPSPQERALARQSIGVTDDRPVLLWVGRLEEPKRPLAALDLAERWPGATVVAGDGSLRAQVEARAGDQRDTRVLGFVPDVDRLYRAADVMAFTSDGAEGYPTVLVEAGAHGVPVVGDERCGAVPALRDMGSVPLPADAGAQAWVDALLASITPARSREVRRYAERHDVRAWVDRHEQILASVVAGRP